MSDLNDKQITDIANFHHVGRDTNGMRLFTDYSLLAFARAILASRTEPEATAPAQDLSAAMADQDQVPYLIVYDDVDQESELVIGATRAAYRFGQISASWNAHLYVKIASNSRDCKYPDAALASSAGDRVDVELRNLTSTETHGDQSVLLTFASCRAAQAFKRAILQSQKGGSHG